MYGDTTYNTIILIVLNDLANKEKYNDGKTWNLNATHTTQRGREGVV